jgi:hypothetical protein
MLMSFKNEKFAILRRVPRFALCLGGVMAFGVASARAEEFGEGIELVPGSSDSELVDGVSDEGSVDIRPAVPVESSEAVSSADVDSVPAPASDQPEFLPVPMHGADSDAADASLLEGGDELSTDAEFDDQQSKEWEQMFRGEPIESAGGGGFFSRVSTGFDIAAEVVYDDNVLYSRRGEEVADVIFRIRPGLFFALGDAEYREASFAKLSYNPTGSVYVDLSSENSFDHDVALALGHIGPKLSAIFDTSYQTITDATVDVGERTERQLFDTGLLMEYALGAKTGLRGEAGYVVEDYDTYAGYEEWRADLYVTYDVRPKTTVGIGYGAGELRPEESDSQRYQRALVRADWRATEKIALSAWGGADFRQSGSEQETTSVYGVELSGRVREGTGVRLNLGRDIEASALVEAESYVRTAISVGIDQRLGSRFTGSFEVGYEDYDYDGSGEGGIGRSDKSWFLRPGLRYQLREDLSAELYYVYRNNDSTIDLFSFKKNQIGASVRYEF